MGILTVGLLTNRAFYLDEPKKTIISGAWTCRDCRKNPLNTQILLELVTGLCEKIAVLEPIIISLQNHNLFTSSSTQADSLSDGTHMSTQTEAEYALPDVQPDHVIDLSIHTPVQPMTQPTAL